MGTKSSVVLLLLLFLESLVGSTTSVKDPYAVLGVDKSASMSEIRTAYRRKAKETHPDKNKGREEEAEQLFFEVANAFEILSDPVRKREYDSGGTRQQQGGAGRGGFSFHFGGSWNFNPHQHFYEMQRQRQNAVYARAQARVMFITGVDHLMSVAFGKDGIVDRHVALALYDEGACERRLNEETIFPYPFAGMSDDHGMWWEDVLQTTKARITDANGQPSELARRFGIAGLGDVACPSIVFVRRGGDLWNEYEVLKRPSAKQFTDFMWEKLKTTVNFVNRHTHTVRVWWLHGNHGRDPFELAPGETQTRISYLSHLFIARDVRVAGHTLNKESSLAWRFIDSDADPFEFHIDTRCVDWNGDCVRWAREGECHRNKPFMEGHCHLSCNTCDQKHHPGFTPQKSEL